MNIGLGLPIGDPATLLTWAQRADAGPFSTLGLLDRLVYHNPEPLVALAILAGATSRIRVQTEVLLAPLRDTALLAKQAATLDRMTGGRLVLGLGIGGRDDDHQVTGIDMRTRGRRLDEQMAVMRRLWSGEPYGDGIGPIGPAPARSGGPEVLFGGFKPPPSNASRAGVTASSQQQRPPGQAACSTPSAGSGRSTTATANRVLSRKSTSRSALQT